MAELRIGTASWKYPSWHGLVYSAPRGIDYLAEYATRFDTVEVDQWFWSLFGPDKVRLPAPSDVESYRAAVPDDFRFSVKVPNAVTLTHFYRKAKSDPIVPNPWFLSSDLFGRFLTAIEPLGDVLGPLMFQFEYLNRRKMASQAAFEDRFGAFVEALPPGPTYALETRNPNYLNDSLFDLMERVGLAPVLLQGYYMPSILKLFEAWRPRLERSRLVIVRLHGPDRRAIEGETGKKWDRIVAPKDDELSGIATMVGDLLHAGVDVYINVNNHYEGSAPLTIERLQERLKL
jgi:uncharacterized protein YecE (DUF72 family)